MSAIGKGDWVQCVDASPDLWGEDHVRLQLDGIYFVTDVGDAYLPDGSVDSGVRLDRDNPSEHDSLWNINRFRPMGGSGRTAADHLLAPAPELETA